MKSNTLLYRQENKYGLIDFQGNILVEATFDYIGQFVNGYAPVQRNRMWGIIDNLGTLVVACQYFEIANLSQSGHFAYRQTEKPGSWQIAHIDGRLFEMPDDYGFYYISQFNEQGLAIVKYYGKYFFMTQNAQLLDEQMFNELYWLDNYNCFVGQPTGRLLVIDEKENVIVYPKKNYDDIYYRSGDLYQVVFDGKSGYINQQGNEVISCEYSAGYAFTQDGLAFVVNNENKGGFIDKTGKVKIPFLYDGDEPGYFYNGIAAVKENNTYYFIDLTGQKMFDLEYAYAENFSEHTNLANVIFLNDDKGFINQKGEIVFSYPEEWQVDSFVYKNITTYCVDGRYGLLDCTGHVLSEPIYDQIVLSEFQGCENAFLKDHKWGYMDDFGQITIAPMFDRAEPFAQNGIAKVSVSNDMGEDEVYIDRLGKPVYVFENYKPHGNFSDSHVVALRDLQVDSFVYFNPQTDYTIKNRYDFASDFYKGEAIVSREFSYCLYDASGNALPLRVVDIKNKEQLVVENF